MKKHVSEMLHSEAEFPVLVQKFPVLVQKFPVLKRTGNLNMLLNLRDKIKKYAPSTCDNREFSKNSGVPPEIETRKIRDSSP
jgi:hypothetical protein